MVRMVGFFFAGLVLVVSGCRERSLPKAAPPPAPVEVATVEHRALPVTMKAIGIVEPVASVQVKSRVLGQVVGVHFADGARVSEGDLLFTIDPRSFETALKRAEANLATIQSAADNASEQAKRYTTLIQRGVASKEQTAQYLTTAESQKSELAARQADVDDAALALEWTRITAPLTGRVGVALLKTGNTVQPNVDTLAVINQMQPIYVAFALPEGALASVRQWMKEGNPRVTVRKPDTGMELGTGALSFVDNVVDRASGMVGFKATFPNKDETLWPGQFVDVTVTLTEEPDALVVPATAVMEGQSGSQVFVVEGEAAQLRKVHVERVTDGLAVIESGLKAGESVITLGQLRVSPGGRVAVKTKPEQSGAGTPAPAP